MGVRTHNPSEPWEPPRPHDGNFGSAPGRMEARPYKRWALLQHATPSIQGASTSQLDCNDVTNPPRFSSNKQMNPFEVYRPLLFSLAYRMLGTRADAEDIVQDAYLRWQAASQEEVRAPKSYLTTVVARLSLDSLKSARRKRETYVGEWLPEPIVEPKGSTALEMAESLSLAFLHVLETLSPDERVAFLLREVFDAEYAEIAATLETSEPNCRQLIARARKHIRDRRPRFQVDQARQQNVLEQFLAACQSGDPSRLLPLL